MNGTGKRVIPRKTEWFETTCRKVSIRMNVEFVPAGGAASRIREPGAETSPTLLAVWDEVATVTYYVSIHESGAVSLRPAGRRSAEIRITSKGGLYWVPMCADTNFARNQPGVFLARACLRVIRRWVANSPGRVMPVGIIRLIKRVHRDCLAGYRHVTPKDIAAFKRWSQWLPQIWPEAVIRHEDFEVYWRSARTTDLTGRDPAVMS